MSNNHLLIGLGGTGGRVLGAFRKTVFQEFRQRELSPDVARVGYLYVDSNDNDLNGQKENWKVLGESVELDPGSKLRISDANLKGALSNLAQRPGIAPWIGDRELIEPLLANATGAAGAQQIRRFGRFLFAASAQSFISSIHGAVDKLTAQGVRAVEFHLCCTLACGTGSGSLIDAITQIRHAYPSPTQFPIYVYGLVTSKPVQVNTGNFYANQYATLLELNALRLGIFKPHDVAAVAPNSLDLQDNFQVAFLISDVNEQNDTADIAEQEQLVADFLYQKVVTLRGNMPDLIRKTHTFEDVAQYPGEPRGTLERSYFFGSFGVKRLAIPEEEIREKLVYTFGRQAARQLQFNNWSEKGFLPVAKRKDLPELVTRPGNNERWFLTDEHLKLSKDFRMSGTVPWPPIAEAWSLEIEGQSQDILDPGSSIPRQDWIPILEKRAAAYFDSRYRDRGVQPYYADKERVVDEYANVIRENIERDLFSRWETGEDSLHDLVLMLAELSHRLEERTKDIDQKITNAGTAQQTSREQMDKHKRDFAKVTLLGRAFGNHKDIFRSFAGAARDYYRWRTEEQALEFAKQLLNKVRNRVEELRSQVDQASGLLSESLKQFDALIDSRCQREEEINFKKKYVRLIEPEQINRVITNLECDRDVQLQQTNAVRRRIVGELGDERSFRGLNRKFSVPEAMLDILTLVSSEAAESAHRKLTSSSADFPPILGVNIVEKLYKKYGGVDGLADAVITLVNSAVSYLAFDSNATQPGVLMKDPNMPKTPRGSITVFLPKCRPDLEERFRAPLKRKFQAAIGGDLKVDVVDTESNSTEITIISTRFWFPLRCTHVLKALRKQFGAKCVPGEAAAFQEIFLQNHNPRLPDLLLPDDSELRQQALTYLLLGKAMKIIELLEDPETGVRHLHLIVRNEAGRATFPPVSLGIDNLIKALSDLDIQAMNPIRNTVLERLAGEYRHVNRKQELLTTMEGILDEIYIACGKRDNDKIYIAFLKAFAEAKRLINI